MLLYEILEETSKKYPNKIAISYENDTITYSKLKRRVDILFYGIKNINIMPNFRIGLYLHNSIDFVVCLFAFSRNSNVICLLNTHLKLKELEIKLDSAKIDVIIMENYLYEIVMKDMPSLEQNYQIILRKGTNNDKSSISDFIKNIIIQDYDEEVIYNTYENALIQSSSGTTGLSKMAYRTYKNIAVDTENIIITFNYTSNDIVYCTVPLCHGYGLTMGLLSPIKCGATIHIERWFMVNRFFSVYHDLKPTIFIGIPESYETMYKYIENSNFHFEYNKWFLCSDSPLTEEIGINFNKVSGVWINQVYGMMEASTISANLNANNANFLSVGKPVNNVLVQVDTSFGNGDRGELLVKSEALSSYYIDAGESIKLPIKEGWFKTKDIGMKDLNGNIFISGRKSKQTLRKDDY